MATIALLAVHAVLAAAQWAPIRHSHADLSQHAHYAGALAHEHDTGHTHGQNRDSEQEHAPASDPGIGSIHFLPAVIAPPVMPLPAPAREMYAHITSQAVPQHLPHAPAFPRGPPVFSA